MAEDFGAPELASSAGVGAALLVRLESGPTQADALAALTAARLNWHELDEQVHSEPVREDTLELLAEWGRQKLIEELALMDSEDECMDDAEELDGDECCLFEGATAAVDSGPPCSAPRGAREVLLHNSIRTQDDWRRV